MGTVKLLKRIGLAFGLVLGLLNTGLAQSPYPNKPVRLIIPYSPGGATDQFARVVADNLSKRLGQPVIVEAKPGAGGTIAADFVAKSAPDGYTVLVADVGPNAIAAGLYPKLPYDPIKDFAPISLAVHSPLMLVTNAELPFRTVGDIVKYGKANPSKLNYASSGNGNISHLAGELFAYQAGIPLQHVPYKGSQAGLLDTITGQVQMTIVTVASGLPHVNSGKLRAIAAAGSERSPLLPSMPTFKESGLPNYDVSSWGGFVAPAGTPREIVTRLNQEIVAILKQDDVKERLTTAGFVAAPSTPSEFSDLIRSEVDKWKRAVKDTNAKVD